MSIVLITLDELRTELRTFSSEIVANLPKPETSSGFPEFLDRKQSAQFLGGISLVSLDLLGKKGLITALHPTPERTVYHIKDLRRYLLSQKKPA